jgi:phytol kinase
MLDNNIIALVITLAASLLWLRIIDFVAHRGWLESKLSRKIIHIGTGPIFVLCWLLFKNTPSARYLAALIPLMITAQFFLVGIGVIKDEAAVQAMSRTGDRREILLGPLFYGVVFVLLTILFWYDLPTGIISLMILCGGDGLADILGRRYGTATTPISNRKTWLGSLGMFIGGWVLSGSIIVIYVQQGIFAQPFTIYLIPITLISLVATIVEALPFRHVDNLTVTIASVLVGVVIF